ncbi:MAG: efflux RND transporter periplasmic adaptor subunit [bacterium]|nr:efflux RND transporter periplasmic adaptor subunit [bacterium]
MKKLIFIIISASLLFLAVNCGKPAPANEKKDAAAKTEKSKKDEGNVEKKKDDKETEAVPVQVVNPNRGDISSFLLFSSNVDAEKIVDIFPMTMGIIEEIRRDEGDYVKKGDVLAVLDDREAVINEKRANINYLQLKAELDRQKAIFEQKMISKDEHERLKFRFQTAKLDWEHNKLLLSYTRITSPISGVVSKRYIKVGNKISTAQLAFSVVQIKEKIAVVNIPAQEREHIYLKQKTVISTGTKEVTGQVKRMSPAIDPESGTFKVTVEVSDPKNLLAVGQFVNVKVVKKVHKNVVLLTKDALLYDGGKIFVFVIDTENKVVKKLIRPGFEEKNMVEVLDGLTTEDRVVTAGKSSVKSKTLVKIVEPVI